MTSRLLLLAVLMNKCFGHIIDIGGVWEIQCPQGCSCEFQRFADLPLHRWTRKNEEQDFDEVDFDVNQPLETELLKVATCVIADNPEELLDRLPSDIQVFTILESGTAATPKLLTSRSFQRFLSLLSLEIQGIEPSPSGPFESGISLTIDALFPLGLTLLYLNLERVKLTNEAKTRSKVNLVVKPIENRTENTKNSGHRLIFLSQQTNDGGNEDKEILPYDVYKEIEGQREHGLFTGLKSLRYLRLYDCSLQDISWHMFDGLENLQQLSLEKNSLKFIPEFCFYGTPNLRKISLANNQLLSLKSTDLAGLLGLKAIDLRGNNLTFLSELSFPPFPALKVADFRGNPLDSVFPSTFEIMNTTLKLYLGGGGSHLTLQKNSFLGLRLLETLHIYNLAIPILERFILQGMPSLRDLKMRGNITSIEFDAFIDLSSLRDLDLANCSLQKISMDAFYGLGNVKKIDLSNNQLVTIPPGLFGLQQQKELREIVLSGNLLTTLPLDFFKNLRGTNRQVQYVKLDGNPWDCGCYMTTWNPQLVSRIRETAPRCTTPKRLHNWGVFHALRKGGLQCRNVRRRRGRKFTDVRKSQEDNNIVS